VRGSSRQRGRQSGNQVNKKKLVFPHEHVRVCAHLRIAVAVYYYGMMVGHPVISHGHLVTAMMNMSNAVAAVAFVLVYHLAALTNGYDIVMIAGEWGIAIAGPDVSGGLGDCVRFGTPCVRLSA